MQIWTKVIIRGVARISEGGSRYSRPHRGSGGTAPSGVQGECPWQGIGGGSPRKILINSVLLHCWISIQNCGKMI